MNDAQRLGPIQLVVDDQTRRGGFAEVFLRPRERLAYKLFRSQRHPDRLLVGARPGSADDERKELPDVFRRAIFQDEVTACQIAARTPALKRYVPRFFGVVPVESVSDGTGSDLSQYYLPSCCYCLDLIDGHAEKLDPSKPHVARLVEEFYAAEIDIGDSSCFFQDDPSRIKIIDFATARFEWLPAFWQGLPLDMT